MQRTDLEVVVWRARREDGEASLPLSRSVKFLDDYNRKLRLHLSYERCGGRPVLRPTAHPSLLWRTTLRHDTLWFPASWAIAHHSASSVDMAHHTATRMLCFPHRVL